MKHFFTSTLRFCCLLLSICFNSIYFGQTTLTYSFTASTQTFVVPTCVFNLSVTIRGAQGGNSNQPGGYGAQVKGVITVTPGQVFYIYVGEQSTGSLGVGGYNGGGNGGVSSLAVGKGGGGATDIRTGGTALSNRILVAGGGGGSSPVPNNSIPTGGYGGGGSSCTSPLGVGGGGGFGGTTGGSGGCSGGTAVNYGTGGAGAGLTSGGALSGLGSGGYGQAGSIGQGGNGGDYAATYGGTVGSTYGGGGGGGGYYGGAGGMGVGAATGGGGGGSSYADNTLFSSVSFSSSSTYTGDGFATISYNINSPLTLANPSVAVCIGNSFILNAGGSSTYTWSTGANTFSTLITPTVNTNYTVSATNSLGCISTAVSTVIVNSTTPTLTVNASSTQICLGNTLTLLAGGANTYTWSNGISNGQAFTPTATANYSVSAANACGISSSVIAISVTAIPVSIVATATSVCAGNMATLTGVASASGFSWQPSGAFSQNLVVTPTATSVYTVTANSGVCYGRAVFTLNVLPTPTLSLSTTATSACAGNPVTMSASGANNFTWNPGNTVASSFVVNPTVTTQYTVTGSNSIGCENTQFQTILVQALPNVTTTSSAYLICGGKSATLTVGGANGYLWNNGSTASSIVVSPSLSTIYNVIGTNTLSGCFNSASVSVSVFNPLVSVSGNTSICIGNSASLSATGANSYTWSNGSLFQGITVSPTTNTVYVVNAMSYSSNVGCPQNFSLQVTVNPKPTLTLSANHETLCLNEILIVNALGAQTYTWNNLSNSSSLSVQQIQNGQFTYSVVGTNTFGCTNSASMAISVQACTSLLDLEIVDWSLTVYPNPAHDYFTIATNTSGNIRIINALGVLIREIRTDEQNYHKAIIDGLGAGLYVIEFENSGKTLIKRIVVSP
ncbi:MAG: T9SS type A sorting domain-containing protein [Bacteroidia bacterium]|nr:T9SS type A sorting domain-containing protein [Bacteroidia bacterium]